MGSFADFEPAFQAPEETRLGLGFQRLRHWQYLSKFAENEPQRAENEVFRGYFQGFSPEIR